MILEINAKREIHQHLVTVYANQPPFDSLSRSAPASMQWRAAVAFGTGGNYVSPAVLLTCARSTNILYRSI
jgi:hypothetical protein